MIVDQLLQRCTQTLQKAGISTARLDCLVLLEDVTGKDRSWLLAHPDYVLPRKQNDIIVHQVGQRKKHEPLAYLRHKVEFYGREFYVDQNVLIPRPETESIIELLKNKLNTNNTRILDLGTGSGCIGISLALEFPNAAVTLADIDKKALEVAQKNAQLLEADVRYATGNLLNNISDYFDVIVTNLPYVPDNYPVNKPVTFEPKRALFAGYDGLDLYRAFWQQIDTLRNKPEIILTESLEEQHGSVKKLAATSGYQLADSDGLVQLFRKTD